MNAGQEGPLHTADREQVWVILAGRLTINGEDHCPGEAVTIPAHADRQVGRDRVEVVPVCLQGEGLRVARSVRKARAPCLRSERT